MMSDTATVGYCKDCKWHDEDGHIDNYGVCELHAGSYGGPVHPQSLAYASAGNDCGAWFVTSGDFGCIQWTQREEVSND